MRIALFSDIHGNIVGLRAVLDQIAQQGGADAYYALGDILAPGPGAEDVIELLDRVGAQMLRGNWDELFIDPAAYIAALPTSLHESSWAYYIWLTRNLSASSMQRLAQLPFSIELQPSPQTNIYLCHAAPHNSSSPTCTAQTSTALLRQTYGQLNATIVAYGHYHAHHVIQLDGKLLINVASIGMTKHKPSAYTMLTLSDERVDVQQCQVAYDRTEYQRLLVERNVPVAASHE